MSRSNDHRSSARSSGKAIEITVNDKRVPDTYWESGQPTQRNPAQKLRRQRSNFVGQKYASSRSSVHNAPPPPRPPSKISEILNKRKPFESYDPTKGVEEREIELLIRNEKSRGRLLEDSNQEALKLEEKRARALRHWEYLRNVTISMARNRRILLAVRKARLDREMEASRKELEEEERQMLEQERRLKEMKEREGHRADQGSERGRDSRDRVYSETVEAESIDYNEYDDVMDTEALRPTKSFVLPRSVPTATGLRNQRHLKSANNIFDKTQNKEEEEGSNLVRISKKLLQPSLDLKLAQSLWQNAGRSLAHLGESLSNVGSMRLSSNKRAITEGGKESILRNEPIRIETKNEPIKTEITERKRSIFAAPAWDPENPTAREELFREIQQMPLVYSGTEKAIDVPEGFAEEAPGQVGIRKENRSTKSKKYAFRAKSVHIQDDKVDVTPNSDHEENREEERGLDAETTFVGEATFDPSKLADELEEQLEEKPAVEHREYKLVDLVEEYRKRCEHIQRKKQQLQKLEQKALRFKDDNTVQKVSTEKERKFFHGYSVLPELYSGKVVFTVIYGEHPSVPKASRLEQNAKHQLYIAVTHLFDFARFEILNKKEPRIAVKLRPKDKTFPLPKDLNSYREVTLDRKSGVISGNHASYTFEISPETLLKRWIFIRVKAYKGAVPSDFLGQVKVDFSTYEQAEDVRIIDEQAYLYGKFKVVGSLDVEMFYKLQQGCLTLTVHSANIFPSSENPGDTSVKIYQRYMDRLVEKLHTSVQRETFMPEYREMFTLKLPKGMIEESVIQFKLMSKPAVTFVKDSLLGEVILAQRTNCDEWKAFFVKALMSPNPKPIKATLPLMFYQ